MWKRIGSRCGPGKDRSIPIKSVPTDWNEDKGQFIKLDNTQIVWRRGRWEKRFNKFQGEFIDFFFYGPGYSDYDCTKVVVQEQDFNGAE